MGLPGHCPPEPQEPAKPQPNAASALLFSSSRRVRKIHRDPFFYSQISRVPGRQSEGRKEDKGAAMPCFAEERGVRGLLHSRPVRDRAGLSSARPRGASLPTTARLPPVPAPCRSHPRP